MTHTEPSPTAPLLCRLAWNGPRARLVRILIYIQLLAALLTASWNFAYVAWFHGVADLRAWYGILEFVSITAFYTGLTLPPLILVVATWRWVKGTAHGVTLVAVVSTLAITAFQFWAILPMVQ